MDRRSEWWYVTVGRQMGVLGGAKGLSSQSDLRPERGQDEEFLGTQGVKRPVPKNPLRGTTKGGRRG